ncbi:MAG: von Willebrand factor type A domain-containing protein [Chloroflexi bacterium]|nr:von Willebrand factor type A domain-containing protein [Chloroflexota bacterium]
MRNDSPDPEMERRLRDHFAAEAEDLQAPDDLWDRLEGELGEQRPPRFTLLRGGAMTLRDRPWLSAAAAAVLVVAIGIATWGFPGDDAAIDDAETAATASQSSAATTTTTITSTASTTSVSADDSGDDATSDSGSSTITAAARSVADDDDSGPASASDAAPRATPTQTPAPPAAATATPQATPAPSVAVPPTPTPDAASGESEESALVEEPVADAAADDADGMADAMDDGMADADDGSSYGRGGEEAEEAAAEDAAEPPAPQRRQPEATTFQDYERSPFVDTSIDAVSTFSLDTDRTSYFLALNWARNGYQVAPDSVRAEEWINAFDYGYDPPRDDRSFAITSDVVRHPLDADLHLARVAFQAPELDDSTPLNVTLVLDASGSMDLGSRVAIARAAAETIRQSLGADDRIAVVHFTTDVLDAYTVEHSAPDDEDVVQSINALAAHDSTNVQAGLDLGVELADAARRERPDAFNYIILMSDGVANVDATDPFAILESAADTDAGNPLRLITIGVGIENYNDVLLEQLAQHGNGWYRYLDDTTQARTTFARENWLALSTPFADQTRAQVTWDPAVVKSWRIVGYENRITPDHTFEQNRKEFAEIYSGAATTVFFELELHDGASASADLGGVEVRWVEPATGESRSQSTRVSGRTHVSFGSGEAQLRLGAIVGLAADRYSSLSTQVEGQPVDPAAVRADLAALRAEFDAISGHVGSAEAYSDFEFLLGWIAAAADVLVPSSGYSR